MFFDYLDGGAFRESALTRNIADFERWYLEQRVLVNVAQRNLGASFLGAPRALPIMLAPVGFAGMFWPQGEVAAARAATAAGLPFCLSTFSVASIEEVAAAVPSESLFFQLYVFKDRGLAAELLQRGWAAGIRTLFLTVGISSIRERDTRNGFRTAARLNVAAMADLARHPGWCLRMAPHGMPELGQVRGRSGVGRGLMAQASYLSANVDPGLCWGDLIWLRDHWRGQLVVKGILSTHDAEQAVAAEAEAIVVSNHGGRQLDDACSSITILPEIAKFVAGRAEIILDGGIRRGSQVIKALALGADAVGIGRSFAYGLAAGGEAGVAEAIALIRAEFDITMGLMGFRSVAELKAAGPSVLRPA
jgi:isopentenyl diphosphate isomerase/L-lactate dehydrogenase-like FMN-dependent dehydrogenase